MGNILACVKQRLDVIDRGNGGKHWQYKDEAVAGLSWLMTTFPAQTDAILYDTDGTPLSGPGRLYQMEQLRELVKKRRFLWRWRRRLLSRSQRKGLLEGRRAGGW